MKKLITTVSAMTLAMPSGADTQTPNATSAMSQEDLQTIYDNQEVFKGSGFIELEVHKTVHLVNDLDQSGDVTLGDELQFTVQVNNLTNAEVSDVAVLDFLESKIELNRGTVAVTQGFVVTGNGFNDPNDAVYIEFGTIAPDWFALANFNVTVVDLEPGVNIITNAAEVYGPSGTFFISDDPTTPMFDPTRVRAYGEPADLIFKNGFEITISGGFS